MNEENEEPNSDKSELAHTIGKWTFRIVLAVGAMMAGLLNNEKVAEIILAILVASFFWM